jgi:predicted cupin superfamily sugar epimerase
MVWRDALARSTGLQHPVNEMKFHFAAYINIQDLEQTFNPSHSHFKWLQNTMESLIKPYLKPSHAAERENPTTIALIKALGLQDHHEGGYLSRTDEDPVETLNSRIQSGELRKASSSAFYLLTPKCPLGAFHMNKARIVHALHAGRARYIIIHPDERDSNGKAKVETFVVGHNVVNGERLQWVVEANVWKGTILLPDKSGMTESNGMLISEVSIHSMLKAFMN